MKAKRSNSSGSLYTDDSRGLPARPSQPFYKGFPMDASNDLTEHLIKPMTTLQASEKIIRPVKDKSFKQRYYNPPDNFKSPIKSYTKYTDVGLRRGKAKPPAPFPDVMFRPKANSTKTRDYANQQEIERKVSHQPSHPQLAWEAVKNFADNNRSSTRANAKDLWKEYNKPHSVKENSNVDVSRDSKLNIKRNKRKSDTFEI